ncbi:MAG: SulP family inorganic anion transporter [Terriglobales bacterium]
MKADMSEWLPKSFLALKDYTPRKFLSDATAGVTVGLVALPLAMAFAIASGVPPQAGLYCAVVAGFLISALGGSTTQIGGPTGAFVVVVYGIVTRYGIDGLYMCTLLAGVLLIGLGITGLGTAVRYIPRPVVVGFTNGIAVTIASTQLKDFFGLKIDKMPGDFAGRIHAVAANFASFSVDATALSVLTIAVILFFSRYVRRVPGYIVALLIGTVIAYVARLPVETVGTRFGGIPSGLPRLVVPNFRWDLIRPVIHPAITVAMLGAIESLMSAVVADRMSGDRHNPNVELIGQGIANVFSPMFGGLPATGAIARTATNIRSGGRTPIAGIVHAATLLVILLVASPLARFVPMSVLAGILFVVSYNMGEWSEIPELLRLSKLEIGVWLLTFGLTVFADLTVAVEAGMIMAALVFIAKVTATTKVSRVTPGYIEDGRAHILQDKKIPGYIAVFRIHGPFLFGMTEKLEHVSARLDELPPVVIVRLRNMTAIDTTGVQALEQFAARVRETGRAILMCGAPEQPREFMERANFVQHIGENNLCANITEALDRARTVFTAMQENGQVPPGWGRRAGEHAPRAGAAVAAVEL